MKIDINKYKSNDVEKVKITWSIDKELVNKFKSLTKELKLNQSLIIEDSIKDIVKQLERIKEKETNK